MTPLTVERLQQLAGRLIVAHESERQRIARELHDDIGQQLAGLSLTLSGLRRRAAVQDPAALQASLTALQHQTMGLADAVARLSQDLHPGALEQAGLIGALKLHCAGFQDQHDIDVTFAATDDFAPPAPDAALCLFRAAEEALQNVAAHAGARRARVDLSYEPGRWTLRIADDGGGFDLAREQRGDGFGLRIVEARARLLHGTVHIDADTGRGTTVTIVIPAET